MDIYNIIINDPVYLVIAVLFILIVLFSIIKKYAKSIILSVFFFVIYLSYIAYKGDDIPNTAIELKKQVVRDGEIMLNKAKKIISNK